MSRSDKTNPWRVKRAHGEVPEALGYIAMVKLLVGRPKGCQEAANERERAARRSVKETLRRARYDEDEDPAPLPQKDIDWDVW